jgi:hypothetical protein
MWETRGYQTAVISPLAPRCQITIYDGIAMLVAAPSGWNTPSAHAAERACAGREWPGRQRALAWPVSPASAGQRQPAGKSFGDGLPDQLGDIHDQIRSGLTWITRIADLAGAHAHDIVQPAIGLTVGQVKHRPHDLTASQRVSAPVPVPLHHDHSPVVSLDHGPEVRPERAVRAFAAGKVRSAEPPGDRTLTAPLGDKEQLLPATVEADRSALGIGETDAIQRLKPHQLLVHKGQPQCYGQQGNAQPNAPHQCPARASHPHVASHRLTNTRICRLASAWQLAGNLPALVDPLDLGWTADVGESSAGQGPARDRASRPGHH